MEKVYYIWPFDLHFLDIFPGVILSGSPNL